MASADIIKYFFETSFGIVLFVSALTDIKKFQIPNIYPLTLVILFLGYASFTNEISLLVLGVRFAFAIAVLYLGFAMWVSGIWGAGDAKLVAALTLWIGIKQFLFFVLATSFALGLVSVVYIFINLKNKKIEKLNFDAIQKIKFPCACSFFIGAVTVFWF
ncbi:MAG: prepilin peptidase [Alphaproteobacteria bacterium]